MDWLNVILIAVALAFISWIITRWKASKPKSSFTIPLRKANKKINPEMIGMRHCAVCGLGWKSSYGTLKDSGMLSKYAHFSGSFSPENLAGLTCTRCGQSFCKEHLNQEIPYSLPGGRCPSCGGTLFVA